ncbi:MAG: hypothetical protein J0I28_02635 [Caulobacterales bacterium]|nr:hypothetical protein [Caulobacterales bacterium]
MQNPGDEGPKPTPLRQGFVSRLGEFAIYAVLAAGGTLVILWLLANTR